MYFCFCHFSLNTDKSFQQLFFSSLLLPFQCFLFFLFFLFLLRSFFIYFFIITDATTEFQPPKKHAHQTTHRCVRTVRDLSLSLLTAQHVSHARLENLVLSLHLDSAQIAAQVGTRTQKEVSNARNALEDSRKSREERLRADHAMWARSPTSPCSSSATIVQKATTLITLGALAVSPVLPGSLLP